MRKRGGIVFSRAKGNRVDSVYDASEVTVWHCELKTGWGCACCGKRTINV